MKLGFSSLSLIMKPVEDIIKIANEHNFEIIEVLIEGPYNIKYLSENKEILRPFKDSDIEIVIHGPSVDLNLASLNEGIRKESLRQILSTIDLANEMNSKIITIHPGQVGRKEDILRKIAIDYSISSIIEAVEYGKDDDIIISVENMPNKFNFLGNSTKEIAEISNKTKANITVDIGHSNTVENTGDFLNLKNISYFHLNDNNGIKDQHLSLGEGTLDLNLLKKVKKGIIELNNFQNVLKSKELIKNLY